MVVEVLDLLGKNLGGYVAGVSLTQVQESLLANVLRTFNVEDLGG